jgi:hypothetical protein
MSPEKQLLVTRSALCRLRLVRESRHLRNSLRWQRVAAAAVRAPAARRVALGLLLSWIGAGRASRFVMLAGHALVFARLAQAAIGYVRGIPPSAGIPGPRIT